jgi:hypothetical protein
VRLDREAGLLQQTGQGGRVEEPEPRPVDPQRVPWSSPVVSVEVTTSRPVWPAARAAFSTVPVPQPTSRADGDPMAGGR